MQGVGVAGAMACPGGVPGMPAMLLPPGAEDVCRVLCCFPPPLFQGERMPRTTQHSPLPNAPHTFRSARPSLLGGGRQSDARTVGEGVFSRASQPFF